MSDFCICQSGKTRSKCCQTFLSGQAVSKTPVQLMRSRYSAFALGGHGDYLFNTWAVSQRKGMTAAELSVRSTDWVDLEIVEKSQKGDQGIVEFKAYYQNGNERLVHHERSTFERTNGQWFYLSGDVF